MQAEDMGNFSISDSEREGTDLPSRSPSPSSTKYRSSSAANFKSGSNTFVHKLHEMVIDPQYQHLISWNYNGTSFVVCNIIEFSREVLPKHFKHNNFSSFVRQLNMYGFHKVNKSPRGHKASADNQTWEFSHSKFLRDRPDLLDEIRRKPIEAETIRRETGDLNNQISAIQNSHKDVLKKMTQMQKNMNEMFAELRDTKEKLAMHQQVIRKLVSVIRTNDELQLDALEMKENDRPSIFITSPEHMMADQSMNYHAQQQHFNNMNMSRPRHRNSFSANTQNTNMNFNMPNQNSFMNQQLLIQRPVSPGLYQSAVNTPLPPSPQPMLEDDDVESNTISPVYSSSPHALFRRENQDYHYEM